MKKTNEEKITAIVEKLNDKYEWFCLNTWTAEDIVINFANHMEEGSIEDSILVSKLCYKLPKYAKEEVMYTAAGCIMRSSRTSFMYWASRVIQLCLC